MWRHGRTELQSSTVFNGQCGQGHPEGSLVGKSPRDEDGLGERATCSGLHHWQTWEVLMEEIDPKWKTSSGNTTAVINKAYARKMAKKTTKSKRCSGTELGGRGAEMKQGGLKGYASNGRVGGRGVHSSRSRKKRSCCERSYGLE